MHILILGSGGREHALSWKIAQSSMVTKLFIAPGNGGVVPPVEAIDLNACDHQAVLEFCRDMKIDLVVVGPEGPLVSGLTDALRKADIAVFGPSQAAAQLEGSKSFTKALCSRASIPTAAYARFESLQPALAYVREQGAPIVIKADGLAAGKGVVVAMTLSEAEEALKDMFSGSLGDAGQSVVVEEFLEGEEASFFVLTDGVTALPLTSAQDHKRVFDGDKGPNTGGMGAYSPAPVLSPALEQQVMAEIILPTIRTMHSEGMPYSGVLYAGLILTKDGPKLIEYNARFGDPECQVLMPRLASDIVPLLLATARGTLLAERAVWRDEFALTVVLAAQGYPGSYSKGSRLKGLEKASALENVVIFHAGTKREGDDVFANGGRVLNVTASGKTVHEAQALAYKAVDLIDWPEGFCRRDIGWRAV
jgi:phosphoribosylamine---glycine ligase